jgi:hypothetical protein
MKMDGGGGELISIEKFRLTKGLTAAYARWCLPEIYALQDAASST